MIPSTRLTELEHWRDAGWTGSRFLRAVVTNDLIGAVIGGTPEDVAALREICAWLIEHCTATLMFQRNALEVWPEKLAARRRARERS